MCLVALNPSHCTRFKAGFFLTCPTVAHRPDFYNLKGESYTSAYLQPMRSDQWAGVIQPTEVRGWWIAMIPLGKSPPSSKAVHQKPVLGGGTSTSPSLGWVQTNENLPCSKPCFADGEGRPTLTYVCKVRRLLWTTSGHCWRFSVFLLQRERIPGPNPTMKKKCRLEDWALQKKMRMFPDVI